MNVWPFSVIVFINIITTIPSPALLHHVYNLKDVCFFFLCSPFNFSIHLIQYVKEPACDG